MSEQLKQALELHKRGDLEKALPLYEHVLNTVDPPFAAFLNASSIWRSQEKLDLSIACLKQGVSLYPNESGLWNNLGNCYLDKGDLSIAIVNYRRALANKPSFVDSRISLSKCLRELGHVHLAYATLKNRYLTSPAKEERQRLLIPIVESLLRINSKSDFKLQPKELEAFLQLVESEVLLQVAGEDPCRAGLLLTELWLEVDQLDRALTSRNKLVEDAKQFFDRPEKKHLKFKSSFHTTWNNLNWNLGIMLIKKGRFKEGWPLFEHGLQVSAAEPQRWQRSLKKPFTPRSTFLAWGRTKR